jgi:hypothetical protein
MKHTKRFSISPVSAAVALALGVALPSAAFAAGMPGLGTVTVGNVTASAGATIGGVVGSTITGLPSGVTLTVTGNSVVQWGGNTTTTDSNPAGFNLSPGSVLNVTGAAGGTSLLNVDASGNPSVIAGLLQSTGTKATRLFIANANGITLTSTGTIAAPYVALIGANLAVGNVAGVPTASATSAQAVFGTGGLVPVTFANGNGNITVQGAIIGDGTAKAPAINATNGLLIAGSGSVNVDFTNVKAANGSATVLGGTSVGVTNAGALNYSGTNFGYGSATSAAPGYFATNVALNNAPVALNYVAAYGNLTFSGNSVLSPAYDWKGTLSNTGSLQMANNSIVGATLAGLGNRWFDTPNATGTGFVNGPVGSINNSGTLTSGGVGITTISNGFTNTGTMNLQAGIGNALSISSGSGDINLGGVVQTNNSQAAIKSATLLTGPGAGNINVSAPLTIGNSGASNGAFFTATAAKGNVNITGAVTVTNSESSSTGNARYTVTGNNITIGANQTVTNVNGTTSKQPLAKLTLNGTSAPGTVTIGAGSTLTAGDVTVSGAVQRLTNLVADGNITATNTGDATAGSNGRFTFIGNNMSGAGAGTITAQVFDLDVMGNVRKSATQLTNNYWNNGLVLKSAGANPTLNLYATGTARQFINLRVAGNITANSATPSGAEFTSPTLTGTLGAGDPNPNRLSQLMLMSTGNLTLAGGGGFNPTGAIPGAQGGYFFFPGLSYFGTIPSVSNPNAIGAGSITALGDVNNSVAIPIAGGQGLYFMTNNLTIGGSLFTNMNSWVNYGPTTTQYNNVTYSVQASPSNISNTLNMAPATNIGHVYTIPTSF